MTKAALIALIAISGIAASANADDASDHLLANAYAQDHGIPVVDCIKRINALSREKQISELNLREVNDEILATLREMKAIMILQQDSKPIESKKHDQE